MTISKKKKLASPPITTKPSHRTWGELYSQNQEIPRYRDSMVRAYQQIGVTHNLSSKTPLADISVKDDLSLMDIAPFTLSKVPDLKNLTLSYELKDATVTVTGSPGRGIATVYDYDIVMYMVSYLAYEMNKIKRVIEENGNANPVLPSRYFEPDVKTLLQFCGRKKGGKQYHSVEKALDRLQGTSVKIVHLDEQRKSRRTGSFSYIGSYEVTSRSDSGSVTGVKIEIPAWIYDGVVRVETPAILSLSREYFDLPDGLHRFLARYARKVAGFGNTVRTSVKEIHQRCGSKLELRYFNRDLKKSLKKLEKKPLPDFSIYYESEGKGKNFVVIKKNHSSQISEIVEQPDEIPLEYSPCLAEKISNAAPNYDPKYLFDTWVEYNTKHQKWSSIKNPELALLGFCKANHTRNPNP